MGMHGINFEIMILLSIYIIIFWFHCDWFKNVSGKYNKTMAIVSLMFFVLIMVEQYLYIRKTNREENVEKIERFYKKMTKENRSVRLLFKITKHPAFTSPNIFVL